MSVILNAATATGAGSGYQVPAFNTTHTYQINITGAPTAVTVALEGSIDGSHWTVLDTHVMSAGELSAGFAMPIVAASPVTMVRANLTVLTGGTAPTVTVLYGQAA